MVVVLIAAENLQDKIVTYSMRDHVIGGWNAPVDLPIPSLPYARVTSPRSWLPLDR
jgi:hypothetical protein